MQDLMRMNPDQYCAKYEVTYQEYQEAFDKAEEKEIREHAEKTNKILLSRGWTQKQIENSRLKSDEYIESQFKRSI
jgi:hypothetical protein